MTLMLMNDSTSPLYNAELAPPEIRGLLVSLQQLATTIGIMIAYWIAYGTNFIGGTGDTQSDWAWRLPLIFQGIPAVVLAIGVWMMPYSPRWLVKDVQEDYALRTLSRLRGRPIDDPLIQVEFLEIKSECEFEIRTFEKKFPHLTENSRRNPWVREVMQYVPIFKAKDSFKRVAIASLVMFFQQWSGIDSSKGILRCKQFRSQLTSNSHLLRAYHLQVVGADQQHELPPCHWNHWHNQCSYYDSSHHGN